MLFCGMVCFDDVVGMVCFDVVVGMFVCVVGKSVLFWNLCFVIDQFGYVVGHLYSRRFPKCPFTGHELLNHVQVVFWRFGFSLCAVFVARYCLHSLGCSCPSTASRGSQLTVGTIGTRCATRDSERQDHNMHQRTIVPRPQQGRQRKPLQPGKQSPQLTSHFHTSCSQS